MTHSYQDMVRRMMVQYGTDYVGPPRRLKAEDSLFRINAIKEETQEYIDAIAEGDIEGQMDALLDLVIFAIGAGVLHGFDMDEGMHRVILANKQKLLAADASESKRGYAKDLIKPPWFRNPYLTDLVTPPVSAYKGIIILEGPDGCGKSTLAEYLQDNYGALIMHSTWSPQLEDHMMDYLAYSLETALSVSERQLVVLDRHFLSDYVYSRVFRSLPERRLPIFRSLYDAFFTYRSSAEKPNINAVFCLPSSVADISSRFNKLKTEREEMYDDMTDVALAYHSLWEGKNITLHSAWFEDMFASAVFTAGGFQSDPQSYKYDWTTEGHDLEAVVQPILKNMRVAK